MPHPQGIEPVKPGYKHTDVGVIPKEWAVAEIGDLEPFVTSGSRGWAAFYKDRGSLFVRITNLSRDSIYLNLADSKFVDIPPDASEGTRTQLREHDVLISITADIGIVGYIDSGVPIPAYINQHIALVRFDLSEVDGKFVSYFLASEKPQRLFQASTDVGAKAGMNLATVRKFKLALPPLLEQHAIATALGDVDALIGALDQLIAKKRDLKQAAMQQLLTGQTRLPGFHGEWGLKTIGELTDCTAGGTPSTSVAGYWNGPIRWMSSGELNFKVVNEVEGRITEQALRNSSTRMIPRKCVLIGLAGQGKTRGTVAINLVELCTNQSIAAIFPSPNFVPEYLYYNLDARYDELRALSTGDSGRGGLNLRIIKSIPVHLPGIAEQTAIAAVLSDMDTEIAALEARRDKTRLLKQGMMQELLTGKTRLV